MRFIHNEAWCWSNPAATTQTGAVWVLPRKDYEAVIREIIELSPSWETQDLRNNARLAFFADFLGHESREIHELAYLEIGRAPYASIKALSSKWPLEQIRKLLQNPIYVEWHPLAILMLAQSGSAADQEYILGRFAALAQFGLTTNLAAWATAAIEIQEDNTVDQIEQDYFSAPSRTQEELLGVITALSEHGTNGHTHLRDRIVQSHSTLLQTYPAMASHVAKDLITWERWELADQLSRIVDNTEHTDPLNSYLVKLYLAQARNVMAGY